MTVREWYQEAILGKHHSLILLINYLVNERKVLKMSDDGEQLTYYLQDRFSQKMNEYLADYKKRRK